MPGPSRTAAPRPPARRDYGGAGGAPRRFQAPLSPLREEALRQEAGGGIDHVQCRLGASERTTARPSGAFSRSPSPPRPPSCQSTTRRSRERSGRRGCSRRGCWPKAPTLSETPSRSPYVLGGGRHPPVRGEPLACSRRLGKGQGGGAGGEPSPPL